MISKELLEWIAKQKKKIDTKYVNNAIFASKQGKVFVHAIKLSEEVGELSAEILQSHGLQRDKGKPKDKDALALEMADVLLTLLVLAENSDIDINKAVKQKVDILNARFADSKS